MNGLLARLSCFGCAAVLVLATSGLAGPILPDFQAASFPNSTQLGNPYFPLVPGTVMRYSAELTDPEDPGESTLVELEDFVTFDTEVVAGIEARVVRAREWEDGLLVEDTFDWFAQDADGNVWYLGEDSTAFEYDDEGNLIGSDTGGSWRAGENGAEPGFIMPAFPPPVGLNYFQEHAPNDDALDQAQILSLNESVTVPAGVFNDVLKVLEFTELEPGQFEHKLYAQGVGLVLIEEDLDDQGIPQSIIPLQEVTVIPLPAALLPGLASLGGLVAGHSIFRRRTRR